MPDLLPLLIAQALPDTLAGLQVKTGSSRATVQRAIDKLRAPPPEGFGMVVVYHRQGSIYRIAHWGVLNLEHPFFGEKP